MVVYRTTGRRSPVVSIKCVVEHYSTTRSYCAQRTPKLVRMEGEPARRTVSAGRDSSVRLLPLSRRIRGFRAYAKQCSYRSDIEIIYVASLLLDDLKPQFWTPPHQTFDGVIGRGAFLWRNHNA